MIFLGPPGTGKTHLATGLGIRACQAGHRVLFATASQWVDRLAEAHNAGRLQAELIRLARYPLLVVDEVGYIPFEAEAANLFFQLVASRYEHASLIVTSNQQFGRWGEVFGDDVVAAAMIDRLVHHADVVALKGDSYRLTQPRPRPRPHSRPPLTPTWSIFGCRQLINFQLPLTAAWNPPTSSSLAEEERLRSLLLRAAARDFRRSQLCYWSCSRNLLIARSAREDRALWPLPSSLTRRRKACLLVRSSRTAARDPGCVESAYFIVARRGRTPPLAPPQHGGARFSDARSCPIWSCSRNV